MTRTSGTLAGRSDPLTREGGPGAERELRAHDELGIALSLQELDGRSAAGSWGGRAEGHRSV